MADCRCRICAKEVHEWQGVRCRHCSAPNREGLANEFVNMAVRSFAWASERWKHDELFAPIGWPGLNPSRMKPYRNAEETFRPDWAALRQRWWGAWDLRGQTVGMGTLKAGWHHILISGANLRGIDLEGARFLAVLFFGCDFSDANLRGATFDLCWFRECSFRGADMTKCRIGDEVPSRMISVDLCGATLRGAQFGACKLCDIRADAETNLEGATFPHATLDDGLGLFAAANAAFYNLLDSKQKGQIRLER